MGHTRAIEGLAHSQFSRHQPTPYGRCHRDITRRWAAAASMTLAPSTTHGGHPRSRGASVLATMASSVRWSRSISSSSGRSLSLRIAIGTSTAIPSNGLRASRPMRPGGRARPAVVLTHGHSLACPRPAMAGSTMTGQGYEPRRSAGVVLTTRTLRGLSAPRRHEGNGKGPGPSEEQAGLGQQNTDGDPVPLRPAPR